MSPNNPAEVRLVNNIAVQFRHLPADQAAAAVADHVKRFWDPRMKRRLIELAAARTEDLDPVAITAAALLR